MTNNTLEVITRSIRPPGRHTTSLTYHYMIFPNIYSIPMPGNDLGTIDIPVNKVNEILFSC